MRTLLAALAGVAVVVGVAWWSGEHAPVDEVALAGRALGIELESRRVDTGDVTLHVVFAGPRDGRPALLLHGFPELWYTWKAQIAALARAGFRVAAPDLRGYNRSDKPAGSASYQGRHFAADAVGLLDALGWRRAFLAGHDVGGGASWRLVFEQPERLERVLIFNAGHPAAWERTRPQDDEDSISWFRTFFRLPFLPELVARSGDYWLLSRNLRETSRPGTFDAETLDLLRSAWARENAISTMIHVYRAGFTPIQGIPDDGRPTVPVRVVWGEHDAFLPVEAARVSAEFLPEGAVTIVPDAGHWILLEEPERTSSMLVDWFSGP